MAREVEGRGDAGEANLQQARPQSGSIAVTRGSFNGYTLPSGSHVKPVTTMEKRKAGLRLPAAKSAIFDFSVAGKLLTSLHVIN